MMRVLMYLVYRSKRNLMNEARKKNGGGSLLDSARDVTRREDWKKADKKERAEDVLRSVKNQKMPMKPGEVESRLGTLRDAKREAEEQERDQNSANRYRDERGEARRREKNDILERARNSGTLGLAPNGKKSRLYEQYGEDVWATVRTKAFKDWFGDWERSGVADYLLGDNFVKELTGDEFAKSDGSIVDRVADYYEKNYGGKVTREGFGTVRLDKRGIRDDISHGLRKNKAAAFAAIPEVIMSGRMIDRQGNWKERGYSSATFAAPIKIGKGQYICTVVATKGAAADGFRVYLHKVNSRKSLPQGLPKTGFSPDITQEEGIAKVLNNILSSKGNSSKVVDENGEPLIVFHGSRNGGGFSEFEPRPAFFSDNEYVSDLFRKESGYGAVVVNDDYIDLDRSDLEDIAQCILGKGHTPIELSRLGRIDWNDRNVINDEAREAILEIINKDGDYSDGDLNTVEFSEDYPLYECFLNMRNPLVLDFEGRYWGEADTPEDHFDEVFDGGYDGMIVRNIIEGSESLRNGKRNEPSTDYITFDPNQVKSRENEGVFSQSNDNIYYRMPSARGARQGNDPNRYKMNRRGRQDVILRKTRPDLTDEQRKGFLDFLDTIDRKDYGRDFELVKDAAFTWFAAGTIKPDEDMYKVKQAVEVLRRENLIGKRSFDEWKSPMELINSFPKTGYKVMNPPIDPDTVSCLKNKKELPHGVTVYEVDEGRTAASKLAARKQLREIINTHFGKESSPWCLLQGDKVTGELTEGSATMWEKYKAHKKRVAFQNGHLLAFFANDKKNVPLWWDRMDHSHEGALPITEKIQGDELGRSAMYDMNEETGEMSEPLMYFRGNKQNGLYEEWDADGKWLKMTCGYRNGRENGKKIEYDREGHIVGETDYVDGKINGKKIEYDSDGKKLSEIEYKDGKADGTARAWYSNGQLRSERHYKDNKNDGLQTTYFEDGHVSERKSYKNDKLDGVYEAYNSSGQHQLIRRENYKDGEKDGLQEGWYSNGQLAIRYTAKNGRGDGDYEEWYSNGQQSKKAHFNNGHYDGVQQEWNENGTLTKREHYKDGKKDGVQEEWIGNGTLVRQVYYKNGELNGEFKTWYDNGRLRRYVNYVDGEEIGEERRYFENGQLSQALHYENGRLNGSYKDYFEDGTLRKDENFRNGQYNGRQVEYDANGNIVGVCHYENGKSVGDWYSVKVYRGIKTTTHTQYKDDRKNGMQSTYINDVLSNRTEYRDGRRNGLYEDYYSNGNRKCTYHFVDGKTCGLQQLFAPDGSLSREWTYDENSHTVGIEKTIDPKTGVVTFEEWDKNSEKVREWTEQPSDEKQKRRTPEEVTEEYTRRVEPVALVNRAKAIRGLKAVVAKKMKPMTRDELKALFLSIQSTTPDGDVVLFHNDAFKKNFRPGGLFVKSIPALGEVIRRSVLAYSGPDSYGGMMRPDGTVHSAHPDVEMVENYIGKVQIDGKDCYVRFTVQRKKNAASEIHSTFVTNVEIYEKEGISTNPTDPFIQREKDLMKIPDANLRVFFNIAKEQQENLRKKGILEDGQKAEKPTETGQNRPNPAENKNIGMPSDGNGQPLRFKMSPGSAEDRARRTERTAKRELTEEEKAEIKKVGDKFREDLDKFISGTKKEVIFDLGRPSSILRFGGVVNKNIRLYGGRLRKKLRKHGYDVEVLRSLPEALADPIAVFNNHDADNNRSILTELQSKNGNILVAVTVGDGTDAKFNLVSTVFAKNDDSINDWFSRDLDTYVNTEKADVLTRYPALNAETLEGLQLNSDGKGSEISGTAEGKSVNSSGNSNYRMPSKESENRNEDVNENLDTGKEDGGDSSSATDRYRSKDKEDSVGLKSDSVGLKQDTSKVSTRSVNAFAKKHGVEAEHVRAYAEAIAAGDVDAARKAGDMIAADVARQRPEGGALQAIERVNKELGRKFGDLHELSERLIHEKAERRRAFMRAEEVLRSVKNQKMPMKPGEVEGRLGTLRDAKREAEEQERDRNRYLFVGHKAMVNSKDTEKLTAGVMADYMEKHGKDAKAIKLATGWERGADGKWRYEIGDGFYIDWTGKKGSREGQEFPLTDFLWRNDYVKYYPFLKDVKVRLIHDNGRSGYYDPVTKTINLNDNFFNHISHEDELKDALAHEIQHAVQFEEGFAIGGNPRMFQSAEYRSLYARFQSLRREDMKSVDVLKETRDTYGKNSAQYKKAKQYYDNVSREYNEVYQKLIGLDKESRDKYNRLAGETEARNAGKRVDFTPEQRRNTLAGETEDVSREKQIALNSLAEAAKYRDSHIGGEAVNVTETKDEKGNVVHTETGADGGKAVITTASDGSANVRNIAANGDLTSVRNYNAEGKLHGVQLTYHDGMRHTDREYFVNGERQGVRIEHVAHGSSAEGVIVTNYKDGVRQGEQRNYKGGVLRAVYNFKDGNFDGNAIEFDEQGRAVSCRVYENGDIVDNITGDALRKYDRPKPQKIGEGEYGDVYSMPENDVRGAVRFLADKKGGEIKGFYKHNDLIVDLVWGFPNGGLRHMIDKHVGYNGDKMKDFATVEELADEMDFVLHNGEWKDRGNGRYEITAGKNYVIIDKNYSGDGKTWVVTAYETERSMKDKGITSKGGRKRPKRNNVDDDEKGISVDSFNDKIEKEGTAANRSRASHGVYGPENHTETPSSHGKSNQISGTTEENTVNSSLRYKMNRRGRQDVILRKTRPDLTDEQRKGFLDFLDTIDRKDYGRDFELVKDATFTWFAAGTIKPDEDMYKVKQAVEVLRRENLIGKRSFDEWKSPMELINSFPKTGYKVMNPPIDPDTVSCLKNKKEIGNGVVVYEIDEGDWEDDPTDENMAKRDDVRRQLREIINTHYGRESSPWCLLQGDANTGKLTRQSAEYWEQYNSYPKRVAFQNGKLLAFFASDDAPLWWDRMDAAHKGVPISRKVKGDELGRNAVYVMNEETGEINETPEYYFKGDTTNGEYRQWWSDGKTLQQIRRTKEGHSDGWQEGFDNYGRPKVKIHYTNGYADQLVQYENGKKCAVKNYNKAGNLDGVLTRYFEDGSVLEIAHYTDGTENGLHEKFWENGTINERVNYVNGKKHGEYIENNDDGSPVVRATYKYGNLVGKYEEWYSHLPYEKKDENGKYAVQKKCVRNYDEQGERDGHAEEYYESGRLKYSTNYKHGEFDGVTEMRRDDEENSIARRETKKDGQLTQEDFGENYTKKVYDEDMRKDDAWETRDKQGNLLKLECYSHGKRQYGWGRWKMVNGKRVLKQRYFFKNDKKDGKWEYFYDNGELEKVINFKNDLMDGPYVRYDENHEVLCEGQYAEDRPDGVWKDRDPHTGVIDYTRYENGITVERWTEKSPDSSRDNGTLRFKMKSVDGAQSKEKRSAGETEEANKENRIVRDEKNRLKGIRGSGGEQAPLTHAEIEKRTPKPTGESGGFGPVYRQESKDVKRAVMFLADKKDGEVKGFFHRDEVGDIDLIWGDSNGGLCRAIDKHVGYNGDVMKDFATVEDMAEFMETILREGKFTVQDAVSGYFSIDDVRVVVKNRFDGKEKNWVVTAIDYKRSKKDKGIATRRTSTSRGVRGLELGNPNNPDAKVNENSGTNKEDGVNSSSSTHRYRSKEEESETSKVSARSVNAFAKKHGVDAEHVRAYAEAIAAEDVDAARKAGDKIVADVARQRPEGGTLQAIERVNKELGRKFGDYPSSETPTGKPLRFRDKDAETEAPAEDGKQQPMRFKMSPSSPENRARRRAKRELTEEEKPEIEQANKDFDNAIDRFDVKDADKTVFYLGVPSSILRFGGVVNKNMKLYANKVVKKIKKHGFGIKELKGLVKAVQDPIAIFNNYGKDDNRSVLTELKTKEGNFLVALNVGKDADVDFNLVSSVFGKSDSKIRDWIDKDYDTYINDEKAQDLLHHPAPIAGTKQGQELNSDGKGSENSDTAEGKSVNSSGNSNYRMSPKESENGISGAGKEKEAGKKSGQFNTDLTENYAQDKESGVDSSSVTDRYRSKDKGKEKEARSGVHSAYISDMDFYKEKETPENATGPHMLRWKGYSEVPNTNLQTFFNIAKETEENLKKKGILGDEKENLTPEDTSLLDELNPHRYTSDQESAAKVNEISGTNKESGVDSSSSTTDRYRSKGKEEEKEETKKEAKKKPNSQFSYLSVFNSNLFV